MKEVARAYGLSSSVSAKGMASVPVGNKFDVLLQGCSVLLVMRRSPHALPRRRCAS